MLIQPMEKSPMLKEHYTYSDIYAFDRSIVVTLEEISPTPAGQPLIINSNYNYAFYPPHYPRFQIMLLVLSLLKCFEIYILVLEGGPMVGLLSGVPFVFSFISGVCLQINDFVSSRRPVAVDGHLDFVAGTIPSTKRLGGSRKVFLGALKNKRRGPWWKIFWITTGILQTVSIVILYFALGQQKTEFVLTWAGFQLVWVILRILIFHLTDSSDPMADRPPSSKQLEALPISMRLRVANLVLAVATYQAHVHPRRLEGYLEDSFSTRQIARLLTPSNMTNIYPLTTSSSSTTSLNSLSTPIKSEKTVSATIKLNVLAVVGDTALSSAAWMRGISKYTPMDLYDSCIVVLALPADGNQLHRILAIPAARAYSAQNVWFDVMANDAESSEAIFIPRGAGARLNVEEQTWIYWIPCDSGEWL
jgi:hypothetical protein